MTTIVRISTSGLEYSAGPLHRGRWGSTEQACLVTVETDTGACGSVIARAHYGMSYRTIADGIHAALAPMILGRALESVADIRAAWQSMMHAHLAQYIPVFSVSAVDVALWDALGVVTGRSVGDLLRPGGAATNVPVYASLPHVDDFDELVDMAHRTLDSGFRGVKLHISADLNRDISGCKALRHRLPADALLMYDATRRPDRDAAARIGRVLEELDYAWFEEPFQPYDVDSFRWLATQSAVSMATFETAPGGPDAVRWALRQKYATYVLVDVYWKAGITGVAQIVADAAALGHRLIMHHGASAPMNAANLHLVAAYPELGAAELLVPYGSYDVGVRLPAIKPGLGVEIPQGPGLGLEWDTDFLRAHLIAGSDVNAVVSRAGSA